MHRPTNEIKNWAKKGKNQKIAIFKLIYSRMNAISAKNSQGLIFLKLFKVFIFGH